MANENADTDGDIIRFLKRLAGLQQPSLATTYAALQNEYNNFDRLHYHREISSGVTAVAFSPNSRYIVYGIWNGTLRLWDTATGKAIGQPLKGHEDRVTSVAFSPDGLRIVSGSFDNTLRLWDAATGQALGSPLKIHDNFVTIACVAFSPNGRHIVSGSGETVHLWDANTGNAIGQPLTGMKMLLPASPSARTVGVSFPAVGIVPYVSGMWPPARLLGRR